MAESFGSSSRQTRTRDIVRVEILREEIHGEGATVYYKVYTKDGKTEDADASLIKENGEWRIAG